MVKLPFELESRIKEQIGAEELKEFKKALNNESYQGLRLNTLKASKEEILDFLKFKDELKPVTWAHDGYYYPQHLRPAKEIAYDLGLYYLQEPSAMSSAELLEVKPGDKVLDLCAAPGGKTTQLATALKGEGILVANDNSPKRVKALVWNLEHWGVTNYLVLNDEPEHFSNAFNGYFNKILVDAPCSGEGMIRKDPGALQSWESYNGERCALMQKSILDEAAKMCAPGGRIQYSTCTFNPLENEGSIKSFLERHPEFHTVEIPCYEGWKKGEVLPDSRQLWPHLVEGEGHFLCQLEKDGVYENKSYTSDCLDITAEELAPFKEFMDELFVNPICGKFKVFNSHVYKVIPDLPDLSGIKVAKLGWYMGMIKGSNFSPSEPLAMGIKASDVKTKLVLGFDDPLVYTYLKGETLMVAGEPGYALVCVDNYPLGFAKSMGTFYKNKYNPNWRRPY